MKITPSPLVAGFSGKAGSAVAASWKGVGYIRKHVIPANPDTAAQQAVRASMARCVTLWRSMSNALKAILDLEGAVESISGFNMFTSLNRALEQAASLLVPCPPDPHVPALAGVAFTPGSVSIVFTWTDPATAGYSKVCIFARKAATNVFVKEILTTLASAGTYTMTGLTASVAYQCYIALLATDLKNCGSFSSGSATPTV